MLHSFFRTKAMTMLLEGHCPTPGVWTMTRKALVPTILPVFITESMKRFDEAHAGTGVAAGI